MKKKILKILSRKKFYERTVDKKIVPQRHSHRPTHIKEMSARKLFKN